MKRTLNVNAAVALTAFGVFIGQASAQVRSANGITSLTVQQSSSNGATIDYANAKAMPMPSKAVVSDATQEMVAALLAPSSLSTAGRSAGDDGDVNPSLSPVMLGAPANLDGVTPQDFGTNHHPFDTARADLNGQATNTHYPYRVAGKLFFNIGSSTFICSASLIKRGVVVTAAHCVANFGHSQFYSNWQFVPGYRNGVAPYGVQTVASATVLTSYFNGTDSCAVSGIVCQDDVALLRLNTVGGAYIGTSIGWFGYGWNGYGYTNNTTLISQLGYPAGLDSAQYMERNDSQGYVSSSNSNNTVIGSNMNGGSSGGPWLVNLGLAAALTGETNGSAPARNTVVGVTSWGYTSNAPKEQGASPFTSGNIVVLVNAVCGGTPAAC